jgi:tetratricopeptide (TPR) repeat protein
MDYVQGVPLTQYCDGARLGVPERLALFVSVCLAVQHAHQKGVIHRDLKPSNLLVSVADGVPVPKVIDFGLVKALHQPLTEQPDETAHGIMAGTPLYMSPEQAELDNPDVDTRADIYALGVVLYELLTGTTPLEKNRVKDTPWPDVLRRIKEEEPPRPSTRMKDEKRRFSLFSSFILHPSSFQELDWIVLKCLEKDRSRRYETANALARDVQRYLNDEVVEARPPGTAYRLGKWLRKHRGPVLACGLVLLALLGGVVGTAWGLVRANEALAAEAAQRQEAVEQRGQAEQQRDRAVKAEELARQRLAQVNAERDTVQEANEFLRLALLGQADVGKQVVFGGLPERDPKVTVRELLDRAAAVVERRSGWRPLTEAAIRQMVGDTYQALGAYDLARGHTERALALRTAHLGADHPDTLASKTTLARVYQEQGQPDRAEPLLQEVLRGLTARLGADDSNTLTIKDNLGLLAHERGEYDRAESIYQEVLQARTARLGAGHHDTLASKNNLAGLYRARGKYARAEPLYLEVLRGLSEQMGASHPHTLVTKCNLAALYQVQRKFDRAESLFLEALQVQTAQLGTDHPSTLATRSNLALLYQVQRKFDRAEPLYLEVVKGRTAKLGADHPRTLTSKHNLAVLYGHTGRFQQSITLLEEVLAGRKRQQGDDHPDTASVGLSLAANYFQLGQLPKAEALIDEWLPRGRARVGLDHPMTQTGAQTALAIYGRMRKPAKAEPLLRDLVAFWKTKAGADAPPYTHHLFLLGDVLLRQQKWAEAERALRESLTVREKTEPNAWTTFYNRSALGVGRGGRERFL